LQPVFATRTVAHWVDVLNKAGVPCGPVYTVPQVFEDSQVRHLQVARSVQSSRGVPVHVISQPVVLSRTPAQIESAAPEWGEHSDEVLREARYDAAAISRFRADGVI
jgi:crotonobetainyl-CoA:carnitine CoA-transferase CaiB-like acyl-CoA transferase